MIHLYPINCSFIHLKMDEHFSETKHLHLKMDEHFSETKHLHLKMMSTFRPLIHLKMDIFAHPSCRLIHFQGLLARLWTPISGLWKD